jgi:Cytochrome c
MHNAFLSAITLGIFTATLVSCNNDAGNKNNAALSTSDNSTQTASISNDSLVKRGNYLVSSIGCDDCHSPKTMGPQGPQLDMEHRLSGYPADRPISKVTGEAMKNGWILMGGDLTSSVGPWGMSFAANLTSDSTGIGNWTEAQFITAIRKGKYKGIETNRDLLPPMPWQNFNHLGDDDLRAIFAYLKSTKPVHNVVPAPKAPTQL